MDEAHAGPDESFEGQLAEMIALREEGKIGGVGLSNVTEELLGEALRTTEIACVQNAFSLVDQSHAPVLAACREHGIPFVPFFPLGSAFPGMPKVTEQAEVAEQASRLDATPAQVGLAWLLDHAPEILLIPGTASVAHLEENVAAGELELDDEARAALAGVRP